MSRRRRPKIATGLYIDLEGEDQVQQHLEGLVLQFPKIPPLIVLRSAMEFRNKISEVIFESGRFIKRPRTKGRHQFFFSDNIQGRGRRVRSNKYAVARMSSRLTNILDNATGTAPSGPRRKRRMLRAAGRMFEAQRVMQRVSAGVLDDIEREASK